MYNPDNLQSVSDFFDGCRGVPLSGKVNGLLDTAAPAWVAGIANTSNGG
ncbi:hypothetical protein GCM10022402_39720 [Salinactinospora qingdaonensis]|uniref:Uncharacterized protein n=1 Tax=Salinactinospora qingdaonensis TaxID=702744 RepID=A0ABP7G830_9ACTN